MFVVGNALPLWQVKAERVAVERDLRSKPLPPVNVATLERGDALNMRLLRRWL